MRSLLYGCCWVGPWTVLMATGFFLVFRYENTPASSPGSPARWPGDTSVPHRTCTTLVAAIHPRCPCTRATLEELEELLAERPAAMIVHVLVYKPSGAADGWEQTDHWRRVHAIPEAQVWTDADGVDAGRFGATASGHVFLYDATGALLFSGGLTNARGHAGESIGRQAILALLAGKKAAPTATPVFGCALTSASSSINGCRECQK